VAQFGVPALRRHAGRNPARRRRMVQNRRQFIRHSRENLKSQTRAPGRRYYGGCEHVDVAESLAIERIKALFSARYANVQPHSDALGARGLT